MKVPLPSSVEEMEPIITVGAAFALSFVGYFVSNRRSRQRNPTLRSSQSESDLSKYRESSSAETDSLSSVAVAKSCLRGLSDGLRILGNEEGPSNVIHKISIAPTRLSSVQEEEETEQGAEDYVTEAQEPVNEPGTDSTTTVPITVDKTESRTESKDSEKEEEIERLRSLAQSLLEKERTLELQILEYYGLKEQESAMKELENQLKINSVEAKFLALKVESLEGENERLKSQVSELEKMKTKLDNNKEKIRLLKKRLRSEDENAKEKITLLRERIEILVEKEEKDAADYEEIESKLERVKELEEEVNELRKLNARLEEENSGLAQRLETVQVFASTCIRSPKEEIVDEANRLREANEKLAEEMEQLRNDHCNSVEEIVYLKWINACLRYELRNYSPSPSQPQSTMARDLNRSPSHSSKEKVKQLILAYSDLGIDVNETGLFNLDLDFNFAPSPQPSNADSNPSKKSGGAKKPSKILSNIKKFVTGKGRHSKDARSNPDKDKQPLLLWDNSSYSCSDTDKSPSSSITTVESSNNNNNRNRFARSENHPRASLNIPRSSKIEEEGARCKSDLGCGKRVRRFQSIRLDCQTSIDFDDPEQAELNKFAHALNSSTASPEIN